MWLKYGLKTQKLLIATRPLPFRYAPVTVGSGRVGAKLAKVQ